MCTIYPQQGKAYALALPAAFVLPGALALGREGGRVPAHVTSTLVAVGTLLCTHYKWSI